MFTPFEKGQKVWLDSHNLKTSYHKKIGPKQEGPFKIEEVLGPVTYQLKLPETWRIHNIFHAVLLRLCMETEAHGNNYPWPLPDLLEGEEVYTVEWILKHWRRGRGYQYYVLWEGYLITEASWESESAFSADGDTLSSCKERHQIPWYMRQRKWIPLGQHVDLNFIFLSYNYGRDFDIVEQELKQTNFKL